MRLKPADKTKNRPKLETKAVGDGGGYWSRITKVDCFYLGETHGLKPVEKSAKQDVVRVAKK